MARASEEGESKLDTKFSKLTGVDKGIKVFAYVILGLFMATIIFPVIYIILALTFGYSMIVAETALLRS